MNLADHLPVRHHGPRCTVVALPDDLKAEVEELLARPGLPASHVSTALKAVGHVIPAATLLRHHRRDCQCAPIASNQTGATP